jgi:hypothetical protein
MPVLVLNSAPRLGHAEWADPVITQPMSFQILLLSYSVQHAGGSTDIKVNQQQPSGGWFRLGAFSMTPGKNHRVEVAGPWTWTMSDSGFRKI